MSSGSTDHGVKASAQAKEENESESELNTAPKVPDQFADESFKLFSKIQVEEPTPQEALQIRNKCLWRILPFLCIGYHLMYVDKQTVSKVRVSISGVIS
jgi:hypothetical protein